MSSDAKGESTAGSVVDEVIAKPTGTEQEGEGKSLKEVVKEGKEEENADTAAADNVAIEGAVQV